MVNITNRYTNYNLDKVFPCFETIQQLDADKTDWNNSDIEFDCSDNQLGLVLNDEEAKLYNELENKSSMLGSIIGFAERSIPIFPDDTRFTSEDATTDFSRLAQMWLEFPNAEVAIPTGYKFGIVAVRLDIFLRLISVAYDLKAPYKSSLSSHEFDTWRLIKYSPMWQDRSDYLNRMAFLIERAAKEKRKSTLDKLFDEMQARCEEYGDDEDLYIFRVEQSNTLKLPTFDGFYGDGTFFTNEGDWTYFNNLLESENTRPRKLPQQFADYLSSNSVEIINKMLQPTKDSDAFNSRPLETSNNDLVVYDDGYHNNLINLSLDSANLELNGHKRKRAIERLTKLFKLETAIESVIKRGSSNSVYELKLVDGRFIVLGGAYELRQQSKVAAKLFEAGVNMPQLSSEKWRKVLDYILEAEEVIETITEADELRGYVLAFFSFDSWQVGNWDNHYSIDFTVADKEALINELKRISSRGFYDCNTREAFLPLGTFLEFLNVRSGKRWTQRELTTLLSRHGFSYRQKSIRYKNEFGETKTFNCGRFWISLTGYLKPQ